MGFISMMTPTEENPPRFDQQMQLPDGRRLGYDEHGAPGGTALFYFHGAPSSRYESRLYLTEELLQALNVRLIVVDRPGMGFSDYQPKRRILDWPQDVLALADHLKVEKFSILAYSLGGPYGLACAYAIPQRLNKVGIVSGAALFTNPELVKNVNEGTRRFLTMPREKPWLSRLFLGMMLGVLPRISPKRFIASAGSMLPEPDRLLVSSDQDFQEGFLHMLREAMRQGSRGAHQESLLSITEPGYHLEDIRAGVLLWHGEVDQNIPVQMARYAAKAIPSCQAKFYYDEGHLSLFKKYAEEIVTALTG